MSLANNPLALHLAGSRVIALDVCKVLVYVCRLS